MRVASRLCVLTERHRCVTVWQMRWDRLFADLEAGLAAQEYAAMHGEVSELTRIEIGRTSLSQRLRAAVGRALVFYCVGGPPISGLLEAVGGDWLLVIDAHQRHHVVALAWLSSIGSLPVATDAAQTPAQERIFTRLDLRHALRGIARDRASVRVLLHDETTVVGTIDRVGEDFIDVAEHPSGEPRRPGSVRAVRAIPIGSVRSVQS